jgi:predicted nucleotidyltransferase
MINTKLLADKIVNALVNSLRSHELHAFKSIYVSGSYCRGDWLNSSSDLDIHMINNDSGTEYRNADLDYIKSIISEVLDGQDFPSHCPGGIDYGFNNISNIPKTYDEACKPSPYANFSTLMFDFKANNIRYTAII